MRKKKSKRFRHLIIFAYLTIFIITFIFIFFIITRNKTQITPSNQSTFHKIFSKINIFSNPNNLSDQILNKIPRKLIINVPILMYHYVEYNKNTADYLRTRQNIIPFIFEQQLQTLKKNSYTSIFNKDLSDFLINSKPLPDKPVVLTFDDGYEDFYTDVFPLLKKYQMKATIYIIVNFLDHPNFLSTSQLKEIAKSDLVEIASHTMNHINLRDTPSEIVKKELKESKIRLEELTGKPIYDFAYPYGGYNEESEELVKEAGYLSAVTVHEGVLQSKENQYLLHRLRPGARTGKALINWIENLEKR